MENILTLKNLTISDVNTNKVIVNNISFYLEKGSCLAIVGESGSGKSVTCRAILQLNPFPLLQSGEIFFKGENVSNLSKKAIRKIRGKNVCMIVQNGMKAFDPTCVIGVHLKETLYEHFAWGKHEIEEKMKTAMESVMLKNPIEIMNKYPHQLSGGMLQRIMIALAIVLEPDLIIADEPTTALDSISQFEVVDQFMKLRERMGTSMIFISHDLGVVKKIADDVLVMKDGNIIERGHTDAIFSEAKHEYTKYLVSTRLALSHNFEKIMRGGSKVAEG